MLYLNLYCIVLFCIVCIVLVCFVLFAFVLFCFVLYNIALLFDIVFFLYYFFSFSYIFVGLGKTVQTIAFLLYLKEQRLVKKQHLIIAPTAVLPNWIDQLQRWAPSLVVAEWSARIEIAERMTHFKVFIFV
jgi:hypothetical protein